MNYEDWAQIAAEITHSLDAIEETLNNSRYQFIQLPSLKTILNVSAIKAINFGVEESKPTVRIEMWSDDILDAYLITDEVDVKMLKHFFEIQF